MTRAIILAAGLGSRLTPHTRDKPKCLVPLIGKTLLKRQLETLNLAGVTDVHIVAGYRASQIEALGITCSRNEEFETTNMVATLFKARSFIEKKGDLIISYGDIVYQLGNLETILKSNGDISVMIDKNWKDLWLQRMENPLDDAETLLMNEDGYITELGKKAASYDQIQGQYTGLIKISGDVVADFVRFYDCLDRNQLYDGKDFLNMHMTSLLQTLIDNGWRIKAAVVENGWLEVDTSEDLHRYEELNKTGELTQLCDLG